MIEQLHERVTSAIADIDSEDGWGGYGHGHLETLQVKINILEKFLVELQEILANEIERRKGF